MRSKKPDSEPFATVAKLLTEGKITMTSALQPRAPQQPEAVSPPSECLLTPSLQQPA